MEKDIGSILKEQRTLANISVKEISDHLTKEGFKASEKTIYSWESGNSQPTPGALLSMCSMYGIEDVLSTFGFNGYDEDGVLKPTYLELDLLEKLRKLNENGRKSVDYHIDALLKYESELKKAQTKKAALVELKPQSKELTVYDLPASAGTGQFLDSDSYQIIEFPVNEIPKNTTFGVRVSGNSMEPQFFDKDIAFVQRVHEVKSGSIGVFILNGDAYIKKMVCDQDECYLVSLNTSYDPIKVKDEDDLRIVGKVLWIS